MNRIHERYKKNKIEPVNKPITEAKKRVSRILVCLSVYLSFCLFILNHPKTTGQKWMNFRMKIARSVHKWKDKWNEFWHGNRSKPKATYMIVFIMK